MTPVLTPRGRRRLVSVVGLALAVSLSGCASKPRPAGSASPSATKTPALPTITPTATIAVPTLGWLVSDGPRLWVYAGNGRIARLDPTTNALGAVTTVVPSHREGGFSADRRGLWLNDYDAGFTYRISSTSLKVDAKVAVGPNPEGLAVDPSSGTVWVANHRGGTVDRIDPATNKVVASIKVGEAGPSGPHQIDVGLGSVWVGVPNAATYFRINPATNKVVARIGVPRGASPCGGFAFSTDAVWTASCGDATGLARIDPATNEVVATIELGGYGSAPVLVNGAPWLVVESPTGGPGRLVRISPTTNTIDRVVSLGDTFVDGGLVIAVGSVWAIDWANSQLLRLPLSAFTS